MTEQTVSVTSPIMTAEAFASVSGLSIAAVKKSLQRGTLPALKVGERRVFVNVAQLTLRCLKEA